MSQLGIGVMIQMLGGNEESVKAYTESLNKVIASAQLVRDELIMEFSDGSAIKFSDTGQSCCESRYMMTDDTPSEFVGAVFLGAEIKEAPSVACDYGDHEIEFLEVKTDKGVFTMASHNEHNGYYGGFCIRVAQVRPATRLF